MYLNLLLLFCFISHCGTTPVPVTGGKGGDVTLTCESEARDISALALSRLSKNILVCEREECKSENSRFFKEGSCDVIIKDLIYSDAGKYFLRVYYSNDQTEILQYKLHIHDEISVKKGEDLKLDVLLTNADKVERNSGSGWTELWRRGHGVSSDGLSVSEQTLIIHEFTDTDSGSYRVLDSNNEALVTVTVTESSPDLKGKRHTDYIRTDVTEQYTVYWILSVLLVCLCFWIWWFWTYSRFLSSRNINFCTGKRIMIPTHVL
ncbi:uncharacterized protein LOC120492786 isoform X2 [Pimephales promelas]|uniref:uncharacterized protein LOC120492786 isoform X2 n=1 Tax=Pimephales promelas TaxID=90988 RepID=UPI001955D041|nr:uncharacterized protein LOC120492786 isoform X2 [Pimephales promelas]